MLWPIGRRLVLLTSTFEMQLGWILTYGPPFLSHGRHLDGPPALEIVSSFEVHTDDEKRKDPEIPCRVTRPTCSGH